MRVLKNIVKVVAVVLVIVIGCELAYALGNGIIRFRYTRPVVFGLSYNRELTLTEAIDNSDELKNLGFTFSGLTAYNK